MRKPNIKSSKVIYKDTHIQVKQDVLEMDSFTWNQVYLAWNHKDAVCVIPYDKGGVYLVRQYRHPSKGFLWQFPGGLFEQGISEKNLAKKELQEEVGFRAEKITKIGVITPEPGLTTAKIHVYVATGLTSTKKHKEKSEIGMKKKFFALSDFENGVKKGTITCGITMSAFFLLQLHLNQF